MLRYRCCYLNRKAMTWYVEETELIWSLSVRILRLQTLSTSERLTLYYDTKAAVFL